MSKSVEFLKCVVCVLTGSLGLSPRSAILPPSPVCPALCRAAQAEKAVSSAPAQLSRPARRESYPHLLLTLVVSTAAQ